MRCSIAVALLVGFACVGSAEVVEYGWEEGGTALNIWPGGSIDAVNDIGNVHGGFHSLRLKKSAADVDGQRPVASIAYIWNLAPSDVVVVFAWRWQEVYGQQAALMFYSCDELPDNPSIGNPTNGMVNPESGWAMMIASDSIDEHSGLVIGIELYGDPSAIVLIDDLYLSFPAHAMVMLPDAGIVGTESVTLSAVKGLFR